MKIHLHTTLLRSIILMGVAGAALSVSYSASAQSSPSLDTPILLEQIEDSPMNMEQLVVASQNPVADLAILPFQNNLFILEGSGKLANRLNIQPALPFQLNEDWNLIVRTILPVITLEDPPPGVSSFGLADITQSFFISPQQPSPSGLIWGLGPILSYPTATDDAFGTGAFGIGPSMVALMIKGRYVFGGLANNIFSVESKGFADAQNQFVAQPFLNINFSDGWFLQSAPLITANWNADSDNRWDVPVGGGIGRTFLIGSQPVTIVATGFYHVVRPDFGPEWTIRIQFTLLFPR